MKSQDVLNYVLTIGIITVFAFVSFVLYEILKTIRTIKTFAQIIAEYSMETKWNLAKFVNFAFPFLSFFRKRLL